jgi:hypothetical protein
MDNTILLALLLVVWNSASAQSPQENQEVMNAAARLKQAAVLRTLEDCKARGGSVKTCNSLLELTDQREVKIIERLKLAPADPAVNMDEMNKEMAACYSPNYGYVETVECWSQLSDRLDSAGKGQSLLSNAGPATGATANQRRSAQTPSTISTNPTIVWILLVMSDGDLHTAGGVFATQAGCEKSKAVSTRLVADSADAKVFTFKCESRTVQK